MPFLNEIIDRLEALGVGVEGSNIFASSKSAIPSGNGPYLTITETGGTGSAKTQNSATERPSAQILVRAASYAAARAMAKAAYDALGGANGLHGVSLNGVGYLNLNARQNLTDIGLDGSGRSMIVFNIDAEKEPS